MTKLDKLQPGKKSDSAKPNETITSESKENTDLSRSKIDNKISKKEQKLLDKTRSALTNLNNDLISDHENKRSNLTQYRTLSKKYEKQLKEIRALSADYFIDKGKVKLELLKKLTAGVSLQALLEIESKFEGTLTKIFTTAPNKIKQGKEYEVHFKGNRFALERIGFAQLLPVNIRKIKVVDAWGNVRYGQRAKNSPKGAFFDTHGRYIEALDKYKFTAVKTLNDKETKSLKERIKPTKKELDFAVDSFLFSYSKAPKQMPTTKEQLKHQARRMVYAAKKAGIPVSFIMSLRRIENARPGYEFGVKSVAGLGFEAQLMLAIRHMQKAVKRYERITKRDAFKQNVPTEGFLYYFSHYYAPTNTYNKAENKINSHHYPNLKKYYEKFSGKNVAKDSKGVEAAKKIIHRGVTPEEVIQSHEYMENAPKFKKPDLMQMKLTLGQKLGRRRCAYYISKLLGVNNPPIVSARKLLAAAMNKENGGKLVRNPANLKRLSLVFFSTYRRGISHVALVYREPDGNKIKIIHHANKNKGVIVSTMRPHNYYGRRFICGVNLNY